MVQSRLGTGVIVPMITPFTKENKIDLNATVRITEYIIQSGTAPFVLGTTGESASIDGRERPDFVKHMINTVAGRSHTYAGISSTSFATSINAAKAYFDMGLSAVVAHAPAYYSLSDEQLQLYFEKLAENIPGALIIYNIPSITHISIPLHIIDKLSHHEKIIGLKDSERNADRLLKALKLWAKRADFTHLIGWGAQMSNGLLNGSDGIVPSSANLTPQLHQDLYLACRQGNVEKANKLQNIADEVSRCYQQDKTQAQALAALKVLLNEIGLCAPYVLPPLTKLAPDEEERLINRMKQLPIYDELSKIKF